MKTSFWTSRPLALSTVSLAAITASLCSASAQPEVTQLDGRPGIDSTPAELRPPAERTDAPITPVPDTPVGAPQPVEIDREADQAPSAADPAAPAETPASGPTLFSIISGSVNFTTLAGAIKAADMEATLTEAGSNTLFAPDNRAFAALPKGVMTVLLEPENQEILRNIISFHIIQGEVKAADLRPRGFATLTGQQVTLAGEPEGKLTVQGANITQVDVKGGNGVIHVIDRVLLPPDFTIEDFQEPKGIAVVVDEVTGEVEKVPLPDDVVPAEEVVVPADAIILPE